MNTDVGSKPTMRRYSPEQKERAVRMVFALREELGSRKPATGLTIVVGGAAMTAAIAKQLGATYVNGTLDAAVTRLRRLQKK